MVIKQFSLISRAVSSTCDSASPRCWNCAASTSAPGLGPCSRRGSCRPCPPPVSARAPATSNSSSSVSLPNSRLNASSSLFDVAKLFPFCARIASDVPAGLSIRWLTFHPTRVLAIFKRVWMRGPSGDLDTFETHQYTLFFLPPEVALVKATESIQMPVRQHRSELHNMAAVREINEPLILSRKPSSVMAFLFGPR